MKTLIRVMIALFLVVVIVVFGALYYIDSIAKKAIEQGGEMALGVPTTLGDIQISLFGGEAELKDLKIANPSGYSGTFMGLGQGGAAVSIGSLMEETIRVPLVHLGGIRVNLIQKDRNNNIEAILARAKELSGSGGQTAPKPSDADGKKVIVDLFTLEDVQVDASLDLLGQVSKVQLVLPKIELRNLGAEENGLPIADILQQVVQAVLGAVQNSSMDLSPALAKLLAGELGDLEGIKAEVIGQAQAEVEKQMQDVQQQVQDKIKEVVPETPAAEGINQVIEEKSGDLLKGVGDLIGGKK